MYQNTIDFSIHEIAKQRIVYIRMCGNNWEDKYGSSIMEQG